jgi:hypothetical protein
MGSRGLGVGSVVLLTVGCVVGSPRRPTAAEAASGPPPPPARERTAAAAFLPPTSPAPEDTASGPPPPGKVWRSGYWHWDGTDHVWVSGRWEAAPRVVP